MSSYAYMGATYMASFTLANVLLKASDLGLETADSVLKWTSSEKVRNIEVLMCVNFLLKVEPVMTDLRRVRSEATTVRKEGVVRNGTEKVCYL